MQTPEWLLHTANLNIERHQITLSSRRALFNAIMPLDPDIFPEQDQLDEAGRKRFNDAALLWIDPTLRPETESRSDSRQLVVRCPVGVHKRLR